MAVEIRKSSGGLILSVTESFDRATLVESESVLAQAVDHHRESVILNLYECEYIDDAGLERLQELGMALREQGRGFTIYVRPMSFVAYRSQNLPQHTAAPESIATAGEERLAERRARRLEKWRAEKPLPQIALATLPTPAAPRQPVEASTGERGKGGGSPGEREAFDIDLKRVSTLAGKDERVIERIWATYTEFLNQGKFPVAPDGSADTQMTLDSNLVAKTLRLNPKTVRQVVEAVSTHLMEVFGSEKG